MQRQAMYPKWRLHCNKWWNLTAKHKCRCDMWLSAEERQKHPQVLCKRLQHNCSPCDEFNTRVMLMVHIHHRIPDGKWSRQVCNATVWLGDRKCVFFRQRVRGSVWAVRAVQNTHVFLTETRVVADEWTLYMARFHITVRFQLISSWNLDTIRKHFWSKLKELLGSRLPSTQWDQGR